MFSSMSDEWNTPKSLFEQLDKEFNFDSDPCPSDVPLKKGMMDSWVLLRERLAEGVVRNGW